MVERELFHLHPGYTFAKLSAKALWDAAQKLLGTLGLSLCGFDSVSFHFSSSFSMSISVFLPDLCLSLSLDSLVSLWEDRCCGCWGHFCTPMVSPALPHLGRSFLGVLGVSEKWGAEGSLWVGAAYEGGAQKEENL